MLSGKGLVVHFPLHKSVMVASGRQWSPVVVRTLSVVARSMSVVVTKRSEGARRSQSNQRQICVSLFYKRLAAENPKHEARNPK
jgi:hypothetical protein